MASYYVWIWTVSVVLLTSVAFYVVKMRKMRTAESIDDVAKAEGKSEKGASDVIIVGAGVAGAALAYALAKDGRRVHLIERDLREPDRFVGEVMQPGGQLMLIQLGLRDCLEEIDAQIMNGLTVYKDGKCSNMFYPVEERKFPMDASGRSFHNGRFVQRLRQKAASLIDVRLEEGTVISLIEEKGVIKGVRYKSKSGAEVKTFAPLTVVCDGAHSNLRRTLGDPKVEVQSYFTAFISKNCQLPDPDTMHLVMGKPAAIALYQIGSTDVRCTAEFLPNGVPRTADTDIPTFLKKFIAPQLPPKLYDIFMKGMENGKIRTVPAKRLATSRCNKKGVVVLGDAFNMRHPIISSGMMVALSDVVILRDLLRPLRSLDDTNKVSRVLESFYSLRKPMAATVNTLANAFHNVLVPSDEAKEAMREACFEYLSRGGVSTSGMMALLGGLNPRSLSLMFHLTAISLLAVARLMFRFPRLHGLWISLKVFLLAANIVGPYLKTEGVMQMFSPTIGIAYRRCLPS